jgi:DtxR family transcriptional regulator, Mn-dependent transcriptional regulator
VADPLLALFVAALVTGGLWVIVHPKWGLWRRWHEGRAGAERVRREDALKHLYHCAATGDLPSVAGLAGALHITRDAAVRVLGLLEADGLVEVAGGRIRLTPDGQTSAVHIIRAHRLWERYLAEKTGYEQTEWHSQAEAWEHRITPEEADRLAAELGHPAYDPHGDPIPTVESPLHEHGGQPLSAAPTDTLLRIVHVEDEPEIVYAQLAAEGIHPGMVVRVVESTPARVRFLSEGDEHILAPIVAGNVSVAPLPEPAAGREAAWASLAQLGLGETAEVAGLSPACRGAERRRFLDLGILPGTPVTATLRSPSGDPTAYLIRGALIALRREQAALVRVREFHVASGVST